MLTRPLIVFDLDGTIIDSHLDLAESANEMLATYGAAPLAVEALTAMIGDGVRMLVERALRAAGCDPAEPAAVARFGAIYDRRLLIHTRPYAGIPEVLAKASEGAPLAVLTNKTEAPTRRLLDAFSLTPRFAAIVGGDSGFSRKPDPAGLAHLAATLGTSLSSTLLIGDSNVDAETARRAGAAFCAARYGFGRVDATPRRAAAATDLSAIITAFIAEVTSGHAPGGSV